MSFITPAFKEDIYELGKSLARSGDRATQEDMGHCLVELANEVLKANEYWDTNNLSLLASKFIRDLPPEVTGQLLLQLIGHRTDEPVNKREALVWAEILGPDHCQTLYHTAVFMTRVA